MFFTLKYGDNQELLMNLNCKVFNLFNYIRRIAKIDDDTELELCDMHGDVKHLQGNKQNYAVYFLKEKEAYILLKVERSLSLDPHKHTYKALLNNEKIINDDFLSRLNSLTKKHHKNTYQGLNKSNKASGAAGTNANGAGAGSKYSNQNKANRKSLSQSINGDFDTSPRSKLESRNNSREFDEFK